MSDLITRRAGGAALAAGAVAFASADLVRRLVEPQAANPSSIAAAVRAHAGAWTLAGLLALASAFLLLVGAAATTRLAPARGAALTRIGAYLLAAGAVASVGHTVGYFADYARLSSNGLDAKAVTAAQGGSDAVSVVVIAVFMLGLLVGPVLLTLGLRRARAVPVWVPVAAIVFVVAGSVSGPAAGVVGLLAALASLGAVGVVLARPQDGDQRRARRTTATTASATAAAATQAP